MHACILPLIDSIPHACFLNCRPPGGYNKDTLEALESLREGEHSPPSLCCVHLLSPPLLPADTPPALPPGRHHAKTHGNQDGDTLVLRKVMKLLSHHSIMSHGGIFMRMVNLGSLVWNCCGVPDHLIMQNVKKIVVNYSWVFV
jgi:hypothetical protein